MDKAAYRPLIPEQTPFESSYMTLPWALHTPAQAEANPGELYPMLVMLHGGYGREVEDGHVMVDVAQYILDTEHGLLSEANRSAYPAFILAPHCTLENSAARCDFYSNEWAGGGGANFNVGEQPSRSGGAALELIEYMIDNYNVDPARIYVTGNSMGGGGTWDFIARRPDLFAAAVPVSGHVPSEQALAKVAQAKVPVWAFTGSNDYTNNHQDTDRAIDYLQSNGGCAWRTEFASTEHDDVLWRNPYLDPGLWPWLFSQSIPRQ